MQVLFRTNTNGASKVLHGITRSSTIALLDPYPQGYLWATIGHASILMPKDMHIVIGSDHAGFELKSELIKALQDRGITVNDVGTRSMESTDYPTYGHAVAEEVAQGRSELGILVCGSGNGVNITANKHHGVRSALAWLPEVASLARQHNNANVLALPARFVTSAEGLAIMDAFLAARFEGGRHERRVSGIEPLEHAAS